MQDQDSNRTHVAIIGSGMSGLFMAKRCLELGVDFKIFEKADEVGGTWRDNRYPGLFVDIPSIDYQLDFVPRYDWSRAFASGPELKQYMIDVAEHLGVRSEIEFNTELSEAHWRGDHWQIRSKDGREFEAEILVAATGFLHQPIIPRIPGRDTFAGPSFHSSRWPEHIDVKGKKIGIVGNGSSGIQILSALAYEDCEVVQFIRTPQWIEICPNPVVPDELRRIAAEDPVEGRKICEDARAAIGQDIRLQNPRWKLAAGHLRDGAQAALREDLELIRDPELRAKLTPDYEPGCKRIPKSVHYFDAVQRDNVEIVRGSVGEITPTGVTMSDGYHVDVDVIVYATGFDAHAYMRPMQVYGAHGKSMDEVWGEGVFSYRGVSVPNFPNFYMLHGPYSPVNNVPVPLTLQHETDYICALITRGRAEKVGFAPTDAALQRFQRLVQQAIPGTSWDGDCNNWYKVNGRAVIWPWFEPEHRAMFNSVVWEDLVTYPLVPAPAREMETVG